MYEALSSNSSTTKKKKKTKEKKEDKFGWNGMCEVCSRDC
jgi:hypothetical protein